ncbi:MAG TPA: hypothetical protein VG889_15135 [Rhizomicrobium sp.]|nr:hypothetical protein [Rhizomicrobium sp.]
MPDIRNICLMGDSHAAALRKGWSTVRRDFPKFRVTFFAGTTEDWDSVVVSEARLVPGSEHLKAQFERSSRGVTEIAGGYDAYVLCGLGPRLSEALRLWVNREEKNRTTWEAYRAAVAESLRDHECARVLPKLRAISRAPARIVAGPHQPLAFCKSSARLDNATAERLRANFYDECRTFAAEHGATFVPQPEETLAPNGVTTRMEFWSGIAKDRRHCNGEYGAIVMRNLLRAIAD